MQSSDSDRYARRLEGLGESRSPIRLVQGPTHKLYLYSGEKLQEKWSKELAFPVMNEVFQWDIMSIRFSDSI